MGMGIGNSAIGKNGNGNGFMGMGGNGNRNSLSRTPLVLHGQWLHILLLHGTRCFFSDGGRNHRQYSLRLPNEEWPG